MDSFKVYTPERLGSSADRETCLSEGTRQLNHQALREHLRHGASWLSNAILISAMYFLGGLTLEGAIGGAAQWTAIALGAYLVLYIIKGHRRIASTRKAGLYWLRNDASHTTLRDRPAANQPEKVRSATVTPIIATQANDQFGDSGMSGRTAMPRSG
jgi:hypothetical protein